MDQVKENKEKRGLMVFLFEKNVLKSRIDERQITNLEV